MSEFDPQLLNDEISAFLAQRNSLQLATQDQAGQLNISYAPFAMMDNSFWILISQLAKHCNNLVEVPQLSIMLIEDEAECKNAFARRRLAYQASAALVARESELWHQGMDALTEKHGAFVRQLASLGDFMLFRLDAQQGLFVKGFGQAFSLVSQSLAEVDFLVRKDSK